MIIGLTGENCGGKSSSAEYLVKKGFQYLSLSDVVREALASEGLEITRDNLTKKANEIREKEGAGALARRIINKMEEGKNYVVDSIRNPEEVRELEKIPNFFLVYVTADPEVRFKRIVKRGRENDPKTFEEFRKVEQRELYGGTKKQFISATTAMAKYKIVNNGDTKEELYRSWDQLLPKLFAEYRSVRPDWDQYFMNIAKTVATRSNCMKRHVAAIIVKDRRIISTGYNGTPRGTRNCDEGGCPRCNSFAASGTKLEDCFCAHAEENAIVQAAYHGVSVKGGTIYTTYSPCLYCTRMIINAGIKEVVYNEEYPLGESSLRLLDEAGVVVRKIKKG